MGAMARLRQPRKSSWASWGQGRFSALGKGALSAQGPSSLLLQATRAAKIADLIHSRTVWGGRIHDRRVHNPAGRVEKQVVPRGLEVTSSLQGTSWLKQSLPGLPQLLFLFPFSIWLTLFKSALVVSSPPPPGSLSLSLPSSPNWNQQQILSALPSKCIHHLPPWSQPPSCLTRIVAVTSSRVSLLLPCSLSSTSSQGHPIGTQVRLYQSPTVALSHSMSFWCPKTLWDPAPFSPPTPCSLCSRHPGVLAVSCTFRCPPLQDPCTCYLPFLKWASPKSLTALLLPSHCYFSQLLSKFVLPTHSKTSPHLNTSCSTYVFSLASFDTL